MTDQKLHNSTHRGPSLLDGQEPRPKRRAKEKIEKMAPICNMMYHDISNMYLICIYSVHFAHSITQVLKWSQVQIPKHSDWRWHKRAVHEDQVHWTWMILALQLLRLCESFNIAGMPRVPGRKLVRSHSDNGSRPVGCTRKILNSLRLWLVCCFSSHDSTNLSFANLEAVPSQRLPPCHKTDTAIDLRRLRSWDLHSAGFSLPSRHTPGICTQQSQ